MVSGDPRPIAAQQLTAPNRPAGTTPLPRLVQLGSRGPGGAYPTRVALQELDLLKELDVVRAQAV